MTAGQLPMPPLPIGETKWKPDAFQIAGAQDVTLVEGWTYAGIGAYYVHATDGPAHASVFNLVHLGSGHRVAVVGHTYMGIEQHRVDQAVALMSEFAELGDWSFTGLTGYQNMDPLLPNKALGWHQRHAPMVSLAVQPTQDHETAQRIAMSRWGNG